jgi:hypothetical protein
MTRDSIESDILAGVSQLLDLAAPQVWNKLSTNCQFLLSEISNNHKNGFEEQRQIRETNDSRTPVALHELVPELQAIYDNLFDINLYIDRTTSDLTIIDIRYYAKTSLKPEYRQLVGARSPMFHCKVALPPTALYRDGKFDINWRYPI